MTNQLRQQYILQQPRRRGSHLVYQRGEDLLDDAEEVLVDFGSAQDHNNDNDNDVDVERQTIRHMQAKSVSSFLALDSDP